MSGLGSLGAGGQDARLASAAIGCRFAPFAFVLLLFAAACGAGPALAAVTPFAGSRVALSLNPDWRLFVGDPAGSEAAAFDDSHWQSVSLPHAWNEDSAFKVAIDRIPTGIAWYRKTFRLPAHTAGRKIFIEFERARQSAEVWINGHFLGRHENGITAFGFDVTKWVKPLPGVNVLAVRTDNSWDYTEKDTGTRFQWNDKNFNVPYGGLIGNVRLHVTGKLYQTLPLYSSLGTTGAYVYADAIDIARRSATLHVESELRNEFAEPRTVVLAVEVRDAAGKRITAFQSEPLQVAAGATVTANAAQRIEALNFWSWGYGYLYDVKSTLLVQGRPVDSVITRTGIRATEFAHGMLRLNGRALQLKGYGQRTTNEWPALGSAVPPWLSDYSNRLMVESGANLVRWMHITPWRQDVESCDRVGLMEAMPAGDSESDATGRQWQQRVEVMRDSIIYNRNSPSILFYEGGNKGISEDHMRELKALRDRYDPHGGRAAGAREMLGSGVAEYGGEMLYINKSAAMPLWQMEYSRDEGLRKYWDELSPPFHKDGDGPLYRGQPAAVYNRNQDSHAIEDIRRWYDYWEQRPGTGTRVNAGGVNIIFSDSNTHFRGAESYRRSGEVDAMRIPKDGYWAHQVMWDGWVDTERPGIHILGHWNYTPGVTKNVYVVASTPKVELFLNGRSLGQGAQSNHFLYTFKNVDWHPGELRAVGSDLSGRSLAEFSEVTAGEPVALRLTAVARPDELRADGADVALVEVEVVDAKGRRCPTALNAVEFDLAGPAEFRGGIAQGQDNYILSRTLPVEGGVNRVLIRSRRKAGRIVLTARSDSLRPASIEFTSHAVAVNGGLSQLPSTARLPINLSRGPTPPGDSFVVSRIAVPVASVTAPGGGHPELAFDDNEATLWSGQGPIRFELARAARLCEITAKFAGFRARSYPIRIAIDGREVYRGVTPRSLGYVTLPLKPVTGTEVTLELMGPEQAKEAFGNIVELQNQGRATTGEEHVGPGELGIIEIEFYEPAAASPCGEQPASGL